MHRDAIQEQATDLPGFTLRPQASLLPCPQYAQFLVNIWDLH